MLPLHTFFTLDLMINAKRSVSSYFPFFQDLNENTEVEARNGKKWPALEVFAKCLEYLKKIANDAINQRHLRSDKDNPDAEVMYKDEQIQWVITIPAIWSISAKEFMRKAAYKVIRMSYNWKYRTFRLYIYFFCFQLLYIYEDFSLSNVCQVNSCGLLDLSVVQIPFM